MGGGGFSIESDNTLLDDYVLALTGKARPQVCFLGTASGDDNRYTRNFYTAFVERDVEPRHIELFGRPRADLHDVLRASDVIYVGGGNTANMLAVWRVHGVDKTLRAAWAQGTVMAGASAGMICWFEAGVTDSFGAAAPLQDGLGLLPGSACPHYDSEPERRPSYQRLVAEGFSEGLAADDYAALHFVDTSLHAWVASRPNAGCYRIERGGEIALTTQYLGDASWT